MKKWGGGGVSGGGMSVVGGCNRLLYGRSGVEGAGVVSCDPKHKIGLDQKNS